MKNEKRKYFICTALILITVVALSGIGSLMKNTETKSKSNAETNAGQSISTEGGQKNKAESSESIIVGEEESSAGKLIVTGTLDSTEKKASKPTATPSAQPTKSPTVTTAPTKKTVTTSKTKKKKIVVAIDAGHQKKGNSETEPNGPGSSVMKAKVSQGTTGVSTGVAEYELNLAVSKKLKKELINRGYKVVMIRETNDVNLSNAERAEIANKKADIFVRIHANGSDDQSVSGALTIYPSKENEFVGYMSAKCKKLSKKVISSLCKATGAKNGGAVAMDNMSGINWCTIPVTIVEMGYMSNPEEDELMQTDEYQNKIVTGIANGIDAYFE